MGLYLTERLQSFRRRLGFYQRYPRHLRTLYRHGSPRKLANLALAETERMLRTTKMRARPYYYWMDVNNYCNLRCPLCDTGRKSLGRDQSMMSFQHFEKLFAKVEPYALEVCLYNWGEPLMNPDVYRIIEHVTRHRVGTNLSTNFSITVSDEKLEALARSGLEHLIVSVDGTTQEVYEIYRKRGRLDQVLGNVRRLRDIRDRLGLKTPHIEWQFIVFKHNEHQKDEVRRTHSELGFDSVRFAAPAMPYVDMFNAELADQFMPEDTDYHQYNPNLLLGKEYMDDQVCHYLYRTAAINSDGGITPCCFLIEDKHDFGNLNEESVDEIWNNDKYRSARSLYSRKPEEGHKPTACNTCPLFKQPNNSEVQRRLAERRVELHRQSAKAVPLVVLEGSAHSGQTSPNGASKCESASS